MILEEFDPKNGENTEKERKTRLDLLIDKLDKTIDR